MDEKMIGQAEGSAGMAMTPEKDPPPREVPVVLAELQLVEQTLAATETIVRAHNQTTEGIVRVHHRQEHRSFQLREELWAAIQRDARR